MDDLRSGSSALVDRVTDTSPLRHRGWPQGLTAAGITLILLLGAAWQADRLYTAMLLKEERADAANRLAACADDLGNAVNRRTALLEGLAAFIRVHSAHGRLEKEFEAFASILHKTAGGTRAVQAMPGGICHFVYPLAGNERVIGLNLLKDNRPHVQEDAQRALATRKVTLSGPYELRQGGLGLISRMAVFEDDAFWGFATIVMDVPHLLAEAAMENRLHGLQIAVRDRHGRIFHGPASIAERGPVIRHVALPEHAWELMAVPHGGWAASVADHRRLPRYLGATAVLFLSTISYLVASRQSYLAIAVARRTRELAAINEQHRQSEKRYRDLVELSPDAVFVNRSNRIVFLNPAAISMFAATTAEQILGKSPYEMFDPGYHAIMRDRIRTLEAGAAVPLIEGRIVRLDGSMRDVEVTAAPFADREGPAIQVILRDVTERRQADDVLRRYEILARNTRDIILFIRQRDSRILDANTAAIAAYVYSLEELRTLTIHDLRSSDTLRLTAAQLDQANAGGIRFETVHRRKDGGTFPVEVSSQGTTIGSERILLSIIRDATRRKAAEETAREHQRQIAHLSRVASVGEMASGLAHELNQPLTAILGYATACQNIARAASGLPARTDEYLQEISSEAVRAAAIVQRVRSYSRKDTPLRQPQDLSRIVREAVGLLRHDLARSRVTPQLDLADGLPPIHADAVQIQQVIINLMQNAMDAMAAVKPAERSLILRTFTESGVKVRVTDAGPGIAPEVKDRFFESFVTTKPNGLGLGLAICRSIIESHGGQLSAMANPARGMTFEFVLPAAPVSSRAEVDMSPAGPRILAAADRR